MKEKLLFYIDESDEGAGVLQPVLNIVSKTEGVIKVCC